MSFLNEKTARRLQQNDKSALFNCIPPDDTARNLTYYDDETLNPKGRLIITIESEGGWKIQSAPFIIVDNQQANIIGRNILPQTGVRLIQEKQKQNVLSVREQEESDPENKQWVKDNFQHVCIRIGKSKNHMMKTQFNHEFMPLQQKRRLIPMHLQERVERELNKLMDQNHIIKLDKCSHRKFISPVVITVKKNQTVKLAIDSKKLNKFIHKNKYQMPNIELLLDNISQLVKSNKYNFREKNATSVLLVVTPVGPSSFKQHFMASRHSS